jgi:hypothetical protein
MLRPNGHEILHRDVIIKIDGKEKPHLIDKLRDQIYTGIVVVDSLADNGFVKQQPVGWARLIVHNDEYFVVFYDDN